MSSKILFGLFGASGFGRETMPIARHTIQTCFAERAFDVEIVFVETSPSKPVVNEVRVVSEEDFIHARAEQKYFNVAIANPKIRQRLAANCEAAGIVPLSLHEKNITTYDRIDIGAGAIICAHSTITSNVKIGKYFHCNIYSYVAHDCVIGDFVTFAPRVSCNGNVQIGNHVYIGTGAILKQGSPDNPLVIGDGAVVGMGAVVTKSVAPHSTVMGNPAKPKT